MSTTDEAYTNRLREIQTRKFKELLQINRLYALSLQRIGLGKTLEIGSGTGRILKYLPNAVGVDHNAHSVAFARKAGLEAYTVKEFEKIMRQPADSSKIELFDSIIFPHVIEHLSADDAHQLVAKYLPFLKFDGSLVFVCPQEAGYKSDSTHVQFYDVEHLVALGEDFGYSLISHFSFPLWRNLGKWLRFNETVVHMKKSMG